MDEREELMALRRMAELEAKAGTAPQPVKESPASAVLSAAVPMLGGSYAPDIVMGGRQVLDSVAQAAARLTGWKVKETEDANKQAWDAYNQQYAPEARFGSSFARGIGQAPVAPAFKAGGLIKSALQGGYTGAQTGFLTPVYDATDDADYLTKKKAQIVGGAAGGAIAGPAGAAISKVIAPKVSGEARQLLDAGVTPTPGQIVGGAVKTAEEKARSIPLFGDAVTAGQRRAIEEYNKSIYAKALEPIGLSMEAKALPAGNDGIKAVGDRLSQAYETVLERSVPSRIDNEFKSALTKLEAIVPQSKRQDFVAEIDRVVRSKATPAQTITPSVAKDIESELGRVAREYAGSSVADERRFGAAIQQAQQEVRNLVARYNPTQRKALDAIDKGWSTLVQIENAGSMLGAKEGIFTPAQFLNAVKKSDPRIRHRGFARGDALNQDYAQSASKVLSQQYPDSGTAGRAMMGVAGLGGLAAIEPTSAALAASTSLAYTPFGQRLAAALLAKRPDELRTLGGLLSATPPWLASPGAAAAIGP